LNKCKLCVRFQDEEYINNKENDDDDEAGQDRFHHFCGIEETLLELRILADLLSESYPSMQIFCAPWTDVNIELA
jgi:hypothetical protein